MREKELKLGKLCPYFAGTATKGKKLKQES